MTTDELKSELQLLGFRIWPNHLNGQYNECTWIATRKTAIESRECECNDGKKIQIVATPHRFAMHGMTHESVEVDVTGEFDGQWFKMNAYAIKPSEFVENLDKIERRLIAAWNAIGEAK